MYYSDDKGTNKFIANVKYFFYIAVPLIIFVVFYAVIILKNFYPLTLSWEENKKLLSYNNEVLVYEWKHQTEEEILFYNQRYRIFIDPLSKMAISKQDKDKYFNSQAVEKRNSERWRDLEILKVGLKLYERRHPYNFPIAVNPEKIEQGSGIYKKLKEVLYNVPTDPDPFGKNSYLYQSADGILYKIVMNFEKLNEYSQLQYSVEAYSYP